MAIGDTTNPNLFGTQNNKQEARKKAELAAQNARMGAGNIPASAFGQEPAVNFFSMEAAGQGNPIEIEVDKKLRDASIMAQREYRNSASTYTMPDGSIRMIFPEPLPGVAVGSPQDTFLKRMESGKPLTDAEIEAGNKFAESMKTTFDPVTGYSRESFEQAQEAKLNPPMTGMRPIDPTTGEPISQSLADALNKIGLPDVQASVPLPKAPQKYDPVTYSQEETRAKLGGMTLNEYLNAPSETEGVSGLRTDPQGRMIPGSGLSDSVFKDYNLQRDQAFPDYEREAAAREARLDARPDFGEAVSDRERRAARGDGISMADQTAMAKANARGASPSEVARGNQVANALGVDLKTGQPRQQGLTFEQQLAKDKFEADQKRNEATAESEQATSEAELADKNSFNTSISSSTSPQGVVDYNQALNEYVRGGGSSKGYLEFLRKGQELEQKAIDAGKKPEITVVEIGGFRALLQDGSYMTGTTVGGEELSTSAIRTLQGKIELIADAEEDYLSGDPERIKRAERTITALDIKNDFGGQLSAKDYFEPNSDDKPKPFDPDALKGKDKEAYDFAIKNPDAPQSNSILRLLGAN